MAIYGHVNSILDSANLLRIFTLILPICSMYGIFINICPKNHPNVGKYTIHGVYGYGSRLDYHQVDYHRPLILVHNPDMFAIVGSPDKNPNIQKFFHHGWMNLMANLRYLAQNS